MPAYRSHRTTRGIRAAAARARRPYAALGRRAGIHNFGER